MIPKLKVQNYQHKSKNEGSVSKPFNAWFAQRGKFPHIVTCLSRHHSGLFTDAFPQRGSLIILGEVDPSSLLFLLSLIVFIRFWNHIVVHFVLVVCLFYWTISFMRIKCLSWFQLSLPMLSYTNAWHRWDDQWDIYWKMNP